MKIKINQRLVMTAGLCLTTGDTLTDDNHSVEFLQHLVDTDNAVLVEPYETKVAQPIEETGPVVKKKRKYTRRKSSS